ncbi:MAG: glycosyltransferase family 39 protein [Candidatus Binatia bacterium]|nr:glycosyltransferase family 39 protein [Candidatus Binatia bacterium]
MRWLQRIPWECVIAAALAAGVLFWRLGERPLLDWDEALYAQIARELVERGSWFELTWGQEPYFKKPPLLFWAIAWSYSVFGVSEWATRLPSVLCGIGSVVLVTALGSRLFGRCAGLWSGMLLLTFYPFLMHGSRQSATDSPVLFFSLLSLWCFWCGRSAPPFLLGVGGAFGAALLAKGIVALLPLLVVCCFCAWAGERQHLRSRFFLSGLVGGILLALPWYSYQVVTYGTSFLRTFLWEETLTRLVTTYDAAFRPWSFYLATFWADVSHCLPLVVGFTALFLSCRSGDWLALPLAFRFVLCWLTLALCVTLSPQTRHSWYLLPVYPPLCLFLVGVGMNVWRSSVPVAGLSWRCPRLFRRAAVGVMLLWCLLLLPGHVRWIADSLNWIEDIYVDRNALLQEVRSSLDPNVPLYAVGSPMPGVVFYGHHPAVFLAEEELETIEASVTPLYTLVPVGPLVERMSARGFTLVGQRGTWCLLSYVPVIEAEAEAQKAVAGEELTDAL